MQARPHATSPPPLWLHFGVIGFIAMWLLRPPFADSYRWERFATVARALPVEALLVTPLLAGIVGVGMSRLLGSARPWRALALATLTGTLVDYGILELAMEERGQARVDKLGLIAGAFVTTVVLLPAFALVFAAARARGRARPGSRVDRCDARRPWLVTAALVASAAGARMACPFAPPEGAGVLLAMACAALFILFAKDGHDLSRLGRLPSPPAPPSGPPVVDYGIGDEERTVTIAPRAAYRDAEKVLAVTRGSPAAARAAMMGIVVADAAVLGVALVVAASSGLGSFARPPRPAPAIDAAGDVAGAAPTDRAEGDPLIPSMREHGVKYTGK